MNKELYEEEMNIDDKDLSVEFVTKKDEVIMYIKKNRMTGQFGRFELTIEDLKNCINFEKLFELIKEYEKIEKD